MRKLFVAGLVLVFMNVLYAQDFKTLIADGTKDAPEKTALQPAVEKLSAEEAEVVKQEALRTEVEFNVYPQMSSEESTYHKDFELLDVAEGFFISREIKYKAYLYTAWSKKLKRNYQGVMVLRRSKNSEGEKQSHVQAHYVYGYRGDKYIRQTSDINHNVLSEIAIFSEPPTKKNERRLVRIIEFSPQGIERIGSIETYSRHNRPNYVPKDPKQKRKAQTPEIYATKLFVQSELGKKTIFYSERFTKLGNTWSESEGLKEIELEKDSTNYVELVKPIFPKGPGEK